MIWPWNKLKSLETRAVVLTRELNNLKYRFNKLEDTLNGGDVECNGCQQYISKLDMNKVGATYLCSICRGEHAE